MNPYDLIIVGAGPAGMTAAVYAARKRMNFLIISSDIGGQAVLSWDIENYLGYQFIAGTELIEKFKEHLQKFAVEVRENEKTAAVEKTGGVVTVQTDKGVYTAKTVIIASGRTHRKLGVDGEERLRSKGIAYCAIDKDRKENLSYRSETHADGRSYHGRKSHREQEGLHLYRHAGKKDLWGAACPRHRDRKRG
jgi:thioredoxin reductase